jgi:hypothetical protein
MMGAVEIWAAREIESSSEIARGGLLRAVYVKVDLRASLQV